MRQVEYYILELLPVKFVPIPGGLAVLKMNRDTGVFENGIEYRARALSIDSWYVDHVTEDNFIQHVESLRSRCLQGEGPLFALYKTMNAIEDAAKAEDRPLTEEEYASRAEMRRQTYAMFQAAHPDDMPD